MKKILVTGGLGFIGSHVVVELINNGFNPIIVDNLSNSKMHILKNIEEIVGCKVKFYNVDLMLESKTNEIFYNERPHAVIHLAGYKSVNESVRHPINYYQNNLITTLNILNAMKYFNCYNLIFSSSATVYGSQSPPFHEEMQVGIGILNPYGQTKYMIEVILKDFSISEPKFNIISLRYFNPIGGHSSGKLTEDPTGIPNNLMPYIVKVANRTLDNLTIFGTDYNTEDGTAERDYIHVVDLAKGHIKALLKDIKGFNVYNLGTGIPISVKKLINEFEKYNNIKIPIILGNRREGDSPRAFALVDKAEKELDWKAEKTIENMVKDSYRIDI